MKRSWLVCCLLAACRGPGASDGAGVPPTVGFEPPVATNAASPVDYPIELYNRGIQGTVVLRLFVDETGEIVPDSTRIAEGSGQPPFDSAAIAGVPLMRFVPARMDGNPVATAFLQPVFFRHPERAQSEPQ